MLDVRGGLGNKQGVPNTIRADFEDFFRDSIKNKDGNLFHGSTFRTAEANLWHMFLQFHLNAFNMNLNNTDTRVSLVYC